MGIPLPIEAATIGWADSLILMLMALVVFGPKKLPQLGRQVGKLMYEFRKASNDFKFQMEEELRAAEDSDRRQREEALRLQQAALNPPVAEASTEAPSENQDDANNPYLGYTDYVKEQERQAEEPAQPNALSVQPPSTGEPVPAQWDAASASEPGSTTILNAPELPTVESPLAPVASADQAQPELSPAAEANPTTEPAPHHG
jgi:sec-independent protein translocase protein TatB